MKCYHYGEHEHYTSSCPYSFDDALVKLMLAQEGSDIYEAKHLTTGMVHYDDSLTHHEDQDTTYQF